MKRKILSVVLAVCMVLGAFPLLNMRVSAASGGVQARLQSFESQYPEGKAWYGSFDGGNTCYGFAKMAVYNIFGGSTVRGKTYRSWYYNGYSASGMTELGFLTAGSYTWDNVKSLLSQAKAGDVLQLDDLGSTNKLEQHSMIICAVNDSSVEVYDCNSNGDSVIHFHTYGYDNWYGRVNPRMTLLRSDNYYAVDGTAGEVAPVPTEPSLSVKNARMTVNVGSGYTLRFCASVSTTSAKLGSIPDGSMVYVYGTTLQQYESRTWAKINYNGTTGWVNAAWLKDVAVSKKPTISISSQSVPSALKAGDSFTVGGIVSTSGGNITKVSATILSASGSVVRGATFWPNTPTHDLSGSIGKELDFSRLIAGSYTYCLIATARDGAEAASATLINAPFTVKAADAVQKPTISISGQNAPSALNVGDSFGIRGTVSTNCGTLTNVTGVVLNASGNPVLSGSYSPNTASLDLRYSINNDLVFNRLAAGTYTYRVTAAAVNGSQSAAVTLIDSAFTVKGAVTVQKPAVSISGQNAPSVLNVGDNFGIRGTVSTDCGTLTNVTGVILNAWGSAVQSGSHNPNAASHDLRYSINNDLIFNDLSAGTYTYRVTATAVNGTQTTTVTLINASFTVRGASAPSDQKPSISISGQNAPSSLRVGANFGIRGVVSTDCGTLTNVTGVILDAWGNTVQSGIYYPNTATHDLRYSINNDLIFNYLAAGSYTYRVTVTAVNGSQSTTVTLISAPFSVS